MVTQIVGLLTFLVFSFISIAMSLTFWTDLAHDSFSWFIMAMVAIGQDGLKSFALISRNFLIDDSVLIRKEETIKKNKNRILLFFIVYLVTLAASLASSFGATLVMVDKKSKGNDLVSYQSQINVEQEKINNNLSLIDTNQITVDRDKKYLSEIGNDLKKKDESDKINYELTSKLSENAKLKSVNTTIKQTIVDLETKEKTENKSKDKNMFQLMGEFLHIPSIVLSSIGMALASIIIEMGLYITSPHRLHRRKIVKSSPSKPPKDKLKKEKVERKSLLEALINPIPKVEIVAQPETKLEVKPKTNLKTMLQQQKNHLSNLVKKISPKVEVPEIVKEKPITKKVPKTSAKPKKVESAKVVEPKIEVKPSVAVPKNNPIKKRKQPINLEIAPSTIEIASTIDKESSVGTFKKDINKYHDTVEFPPRPAKK